MWQEHYPDSDFKNLEFIEASLSEGFIVEGEFHLITDAEVFGWERPQARTRQKQTVETPESLYADLLSTGRTSMNIHVEAWRRSRYDLERIKVTDASFTFVALDAGGRPRPVPRE